MTSQPSLYCQALAFQRVQEHSPCPPCTPSLHSAGTTDITHVETRVRLVSLVLEGRSQRRSGVAVPWQNSLSVPGFPLHSWVLPGCKGKRSKGEKGSLCAPCFGEGILSFLKNVSHGPLRCSCPRGKAHPGCTLSPTHPCELFCFMEHKYSMDPLNFIS